MAFMEDRHLLHRNLAARNIFLFTPMTIKVAGFGRGRKISAFDDEELEDKATKIPFRWMALESLLDGEFNFKTDVWAFGKKYLILICFRINVTILTKREHLGCLQVSLWFMTKLTAH